MSLGEVKSHRVSGKEREREKRILWKDRYGKTLVVRLGKHSNDGKAEPGDTLGRKFACCHQGTNDQLAPPRYTIESQSSSRYISGSACSS